MIIAGNFLAILRTCAPLLMCFDSMYLAIPTILLSINGIHLSSAYLITCKSSLSSGFSSNSFSGISI